MLLREYSGRHRHSLQDGFGKTEKIFPVRQPQVFLHIGIFNICSGIGNNLIKNTLRVAHTPVARFGNPGKSALGLILIPSFGGNLAQISDNFFKGYSAKIIALTARKDGGGNFMAFGCGKNKNYVMDGGSSRVFKSALKASRVSMCTSSII